MLTRSNHALVLEPTMDMQTEYDKYTGWIRTNYSFVVDALSGERLEVEEEAPPVSLASWKAALPLGALPGGTAAPQAA